MSHTTAESLAPSTAVPDSAVPRSASNRNRLRDLFLISFLLLFLELTSIRWFGSTVIFLSYFTNLILLGCFLGMSVGCLAAPSAARLRLLDAATVARWECCSRG